MNRVIKNTISNDCALKIQRKSFCTEIVKAAGSTDGQFINEHEQKQTISNNIQQYDVAIVGGGMVGMALACFLASMPLTKQLSVAIIDSNPALGSGLCIKKDDPPDPRVSTITPMSISFLQEAGAWKYVEQNRHAYFDKMQVWDYTGLGYARYDARDVNKDFLGCVAENKVLHSALLSCIKDSDFNKTIYPLSLTSMTLNPSSMSMVDVSFASKESSAQGQSAKLQLSDGSSIYAKLVVGADGGKSRVRELAEFRTTGWNYSQNAIICTVEHASENRCAWQRFLPTGPIALLPMGDKFSNIVWTMNPTESNNRKSICEEAFLKDVNSALDYGYGPHPKSSLSGNRDIFSWFKIDQTLSASEFFEIPPKVVRLASERMVFPLSLRHANSYASKLAVLIGDAAHTVHPLAGQGVNLGFGDAFSLSRIIAEGIALGTDIGEVNLLKKYEADRKPANITMMAILDGFQKAYSIDFGPFNFMRAAAFSGSNYISPLKRSIISYASGDQKFPLFL
ncbi:putative FAD-binding domain, ubiquinone biosynthesis hydroxylase UbiH/COQ6 [Lupinus albus]|uniref:Ubiquinone biosynthesis monooxygenase COQ6, mitochondrial n=1 Tax=Lupinus albus TaxID=3870 RepID=A0A6A4NEM6_LUPAL|nr:putative FAD-binding domain, ubiquinone biosynthesis hydroxylase UbiH/COQ6 [Lupinus albus]